MNLQECILAQYFETYGQQTLQVVSQKTGIQITRVFRLLNGSEMKLSEYEKFSQAIALKDARKKNLSDKQREFLELSEQCLKIIPKNSLEQMIDQMERKLLMYSLQ